MRITLTPAEQDRAVRVEDLPEVVVGGTRLRLAKEGLVPSAADSHIAHPYDRPGALHSGSPPAACRTKLIRRDRMARKPHRRAVRLGDWSVIAQVDRWLQTQLLQHFSHPLLLFRRVDFRFFRML